MGAIYEDARLRDRTGVFRDRKHAGEQLALFLGERFEFSKPLICPIPAGGVPVGFMLARCFRAPLMLAVVRKMQIPGNTESGFGAVTWRGDTIINQDLVRRLHLRSEEIDHAISRAKASVEERIRKYAVRKPRQETAGSTVILTDDGLASGFTMQAAAEAIRRENPGRVVVAVPTGSFAAVQRVSAYADELICLNIRSGFSFAVADAYVYWHDLTDEEVQSCLDQAIQAGLY
jgi:putative phosphoribosyl transferase